MTIKRITKLKADKKHINCIQNRNRQRITEKDHKNTISFIDKVS